MVFVLLLVYINIAEITFKDWRPPSSLFSFVHIFTFHFLFHLSVAVLSKFHEYNKLWNILILLKLFLAINRGSESTQNKLTIALWARGWGKSKLWDYHTTLLCFAKMVCHSKTVFPCQIVLAYYDNLKMNKQNPNFYLEWCWKILIYQMADVHAD